MILQYKFTSFFFFEGDNATFPTVLHVIAAAGASVFQWHFEMTYERAGKMYI